jgi:hypothetical protein
MPDNPTTPGHDAAPGAHNRIVLAGRLKSRANGIVQIEVIDGLTVDLSEDDCTVVHETTDAVTHRAMVAIELKGDKPVTAVFQPHFYRVLAGARALPFVFRPGRVGSPRDFAAALGAARPADGGGGSVHHFTSMLTNTWFGTEKDGSKPDSADEPGEIVLN